MARLVPDDAAEVVGEVGVVAKVGTHVLRVDGVDDVLYWGRDSIGKQFWPQKRLEIRISFRFWDISCIPRAPIQYAFESPSDFLFEFPSERLFEILYWKPPKIVSFDMSHVKQVFK